MEAEKLEPYIDYFVGELPSRESVDILLFLLGERPACLVMDPEREEKDTLIDLCREFGLSFLEEDSGVSTLSKSGFFIARDEERFRYLEDSDGRFYGFSDRDVGRFLGFPEDDVDFFAENAEAGPVEPRTREVIDSLVRRGEIDPGNAQLIQLASYVPKPEEENVLRAVERGKVYRDALIQFDERTGSGIGKRLLEDFLNQVRV